MDEKSLFDQVEFGRNHILLVARDVTEEEADVLPRGFRNNIRWNLGHTLVAHEKILGRVGIKTMHLPERYVELFDGGTSPAGWNGPVPSLDELGGYLRRQPAETRRLLCGRTADALEKPFRFRTVGEVLNFAYYHEAIHTGFIQALLRAVRSVEP